MKGIGIQDVAADAGVSATTVSHVLNDTPQAQRISAETRQRGPRGRRASSATAQPGWRAACGTSASGRSALVSDAIATTPYAGQIILGAQEAASEHGWLLVLVNTDGDPRSSSSRAPGAPPAPGGRVPLRDDVPPAVVGASGPSRRSGGAARRGRSGGTAHPVGGPR